MEKRRGWIVLLIVLLILCFSFVWVYFYNAISNFLGDTIYILFFIIVLIIGVNIIVNELEKKHKIKITQEDKKRADDFKEYLTDEFKTVKILPFSKIQYSIKKFEAKKGANGRIVVNVTHEFKNFEEFAKYFDIPE